MPSERHQGALLPSRKNRRDPRAILGLLLLCAWSDTYASEPATNLHVQVGVAENAQSLSVGGGRDLRWKTNTKYGPVTAQWQAEVGIWRTDARTHVQIGFTPALRLYPSAWGGKWFLEGGIGANIISPLYRADEKRFSTAFNFGDHLAVGRRWGSRGEHEWSLRLQHFSNASIKRPNPGENFLQLRYTLRAGNL